MMRPRCNLCQKEFDQPDLETCPDCEMDYCKRCLPIHVGYATRYVLAALAAVTVAILVIVVVSLIKAS